MKKLLIGLTLLATFLSVQASEQTIQYCSSPDNSTVVELKTVIKEGYVDTYFLQSLIINNKVYHEKNSQEVLCKRGETVLCYLEENIISLFLRSYTPHSGLIVYELGGRSVDDVLGLECSELNF